MNTQPLTQRRGDSQRPAEKTFNFSSALIRVLCVSALSLCFSARAQTTPVLFSEQSLTGTIINRTLTLTPDQGQTTPLYNGTNLIPVGAIVLHPTAGVIITNLVSWGYTLTMDGWSRSLHILVPVSATLQNAINLINPNSYTGPYIVTGPVTLTSSNSSVTLAESTNANAINYDLAAQGGGGSGTGTLTNALPTNAPIPSVSGPIVFVPTNFATPAVVSGIIGQSNYVAATTLALTNNLALIAATNAAAQAAKSATNALMQSGVVTTNGQALTIYVAAAGSNLKSGLTPQTAVNTLDYAYSLVPNNGTIIVNNGDAIYCSNTIVWWKSAAVVAYNASITFPTGNYLCISNGNLTLFGGHYIFSDPATTPLQYSVRTNGSAYYLQQTETNTFYDVNFDGSQGSIDIIWGLQGAMQNAEFSVYARNCWFSSTYDTVNLNWGQNSPNVPLQFDGCHFNVNANGNQPYARAVVAAGGNWILNNCDALVTGGTTGDYCVHAIGSAIVTINSGAYIGSTGGDGGSYSTFYAASQSSYYSQIYLNAVTYDSLQNDAGSAIYVRNPVLLGIPATATAGPILTTNGAGQIVPSYNAASLTNLQGILVKVMLTNTAGGAYTFSTNNSIVTEWLGTNGLGGGSGTLPLNLVTNNGTATITNLQPYTTGEPGPAQWWIETNIMGSFTLSNNIYATAPFVFSTNGSFTAAGAGSFGGNCIVAGLFTNSTEITANKLTTGSIQTTSFFLANTPEGAAMGVNQVGFGELDFGGFGPSGKYAPLAFISGPGGANSPVLTYGTITTNGNWMLTAITTTNGIVTGLQPTASSFQWANVPQFSSTTTNYWIGCWTNGCLSAIYSNTASTYAIKQLAP